MGFVLLVTPLVKSPTLPSTLDEKFRAPFVTEAAKVEPGREGILIGLELRPASRRGVDTFAPATEVAVR